MEGGLGELGISVVLDTSTLDRQIKGLGSKYNDRLGDFKIPVLLNTGDFDREFRQWQSRYSNNGFDVNVRLKLDNTQVSKIKERISRDINTSVSVNYSGAKQQLKLDNSAFDGIGDRVGKSISSSFEKLGDGLGETLGKSIKKAVPQRGIFGKLFDGITDTLLAPLRSIGRGVFEGIGQPIGKSLGSGIQLGIDQVTSGIIGDSQLLGEKIAVSLGDGIKKVLPEILGNNLSKQINLLLEDTIGIDNILIRSRSNQSSKQKQLARQKEEATPLLRQEYIQSASLKSRGNELEQELNVLKPAYEEQLRNFKQRFNQEADRLRNRSLLINIDVSPEQIAESINQGMKAAKLKTRVSVADVTPQQVIAHSEAATLKARNEYVATGLHFQFNEEKAALDRQLQVLNQKTTEFNQIINKVSHGIAALQASGGLQKEQLKIQHSEIYRQIASEVAKASGVQIQNDRLPQLAPSSTMREEASGQYLPENNVINIPEKAYQNLISGNADFKTIETIVHELRHALQFNFGANDARQTKTSAVELIQPTPQEIKTLGKKIEISTASQPESLQGLLRKLEADAYTFAERNAKQIFQNISKELSISKFEQSAGIGGSKIDALIKSSQKEALSKIIKIKNLANEYGIDLSKEINETIKSFELISFKIEPLFEKARSIDLLPQEEIQALFNDLQQEAETAISFVNQKVGEIKDTLLTKKVATSKQNLQPVEQEAVLPEAYKTIFSKVSGFSGLKTGDIPKLETVGGELQEFFKKTGTIAAYLSKINKIVLNPQTVKAMQSGQPLSYEAVGSAVHEMRHAAQLGFGKISTQDLAKGKIAVDLLIPTPEELELFKDELEKSVAAAKVSMPEVPEEIIRAIEADAYMFEMLYGQTIFDSINEISTSIQNTVEKNKSANIDNELEQNIKARLMQLQPKLVREIAKNFSVPISSSGKGYLPKNDLISNLLKKADLKDLNFHVPDVSEPSKEIIEYAKQIVSLPVREAEETIKEIYASISSALKETINQDAANTDIKSLVALLGEIEETHQLIMLMMGDADKELFNKLKAFKTNVVKLKQQGTLARFNAQSQQFSQQRVTTPQTVEQMARVGGSLSAAGVVGNKIPSFDEIQKRFDRVYTKVQKELEVFNKTFDSIVPPTPKPGIINSLKHNLDLAYRKGLNFVDTFKINLIVSLDKLLGNFDKYSKQIKFIDNLPSLPNRIGKSTVAERGVKLSQSANNLSEMAFNYAQSGDEATRPKKLSVASNVTQELDKLETFIAAKDFKGIGKATGNIENYFKELGISSQQLSAIIGHDETQIAGSIRKISSIFNTLDENAQKLTGKSLSDLGKALFNTAKAFLAFHVLNSVQNWLQGIGAQTLEVATRFQTLQKTIAFIAGSPAKGAETMGFLKSEVDRVSGNYQAAVEGYKTIAASSRGTRLEGKQTNEIFSAVNQASAVYGLTNEQTSGALLAVSQMISKGCYDSQTEVLTSKGWIEWKDINKSHLFITLNTITQEIECQPSLRLIRYRHKGRMLRIKSNDIDLLVTPDHRLIVEDSEVHGKIQIIKADELIKKPYYFLVNLDGKKSLLNPDEWEWIDNFDDEVFCAEVGNTTLFVRRNAKTCWSGNSIQAEELRGQLSERIPGALQIMARALGVTEQQLGKLLESGSLGASEVLPKFAKQLAMETAGGVAGAANTSQGSINRLNNAIQQIQVAIGSAAIPAQVATFNLLSSALKLVADNSEIIMPIVGALSLLLGGQLAASLAVAAKGFLTTKFGIDLAKTSLMGFAATAGKAMLILGLQTIALAAAFKGIEAVWGMANVAIGKNDLSDWADRTEKNVQRVEEAMKRLKNKGEEKPDSKKQEVAPSAGWWDIVGNTKEELAKNGEDLGIWKHIRSYGDWNKDNRRIAAGNQSISTSQITNAASELISGFTGGKTLEEAIKSSKQGKFYGKGALADIAKADAEIARKQIEKQGVLRTEGEGSERAKQIQSEIDTLTQKRAKAAKEVTEVRSQLSQQIQELKEKIKSESDPQIKAGMESDLQALEKFQSQLQRIETQAGVSSADAIVRFTEAMRELGIAISESAGKAQEWLTVQNTIATKTAIEGFGKDRLAGRNLQSKQLENQRDALKQQIKDQEDAAQKLGGLLNDGNNQSLLKAAGVDNTMSPERLRAIAETTKDAAQKKAIESLAQAKELNRDKLKNEEQLAQTELQIKQQAEQAAIAEIQRSAAIAQAATRQSENARVAEIQKAGVNRRLTEEQVAEEIASIQMDGKKRSLLALNSEERQLDEYYKKGLISAEQYDERKRELASRFSDEQKALSDAEIALTEATNRRKLADYEFALKKREALTEASFTKEINRIKGLQASGKISGRQAEVLTNTVQRQNLKDQRSEVQTQINDTYRQERALTISPRQAEEKRIQLKQRLGQIDQQIADNQIQANEQALRALELANQRAETAIEISQQKRISIIKAAQAKGQLSDRQAQEKLNQIQTETLTKQIGQTQRKLTENKTLVQSGKLSPEEGKTRELELQKQLEGQKQQLSEAALQKKQVEIQKYELLDQRRNSQIEINEQKRINIIKASQLKGDLSDRQVQEKIGQAQSKSIQDRINLIKSQIDREKVLAQQGTRSREDSVNRQIELQKQLGQATQQQIDNEIQKLANLRAAIDKTIAIREAQNNLVNSKAQLKLATKEADAVEITGKVSPLQELQFEQDKLAAEGDRLIRQRQTIQDKLAALPKKKLSKEDEKLERLGLQDQLLQSDISFQQNRRAKAINREQYRTKAAELGINGDIINSGLEAARKNSELAQREAEMAIASGGLSIDNALIKLDQNRARLQAAQNKLLADLEINRDKQARIKKPRNQEEANQLKELQKEEFDIKAGLSENRTDLAANVAEKRNKRTELEMAKAELAVSQRQLELAKQELTVMRSGAPYNQQQFKLQADRNRILNERQTLLEKERIARERLDGLKPGASEELRLRLTKELAEAQTASLENEKALIQNNRDLAIDKLQQEIDYQKKLGDEKTIALEKEKQGLDTTQKLLDITKQLVDSRANLSKAIAEANVTQSESNLTKADRAVEAARRLKEDENLSPEVRAALESRLRSAGLSSNASEMDALLAKQQAENDVAQKKMEARAQEELIAQRQLEIEIQRNKLAAEMQVAEANITLLKQQQAELEAKMNLEKAKKNGDAREIANAKSQVDLATQSTSVAETQVDIANKNLEMQDEIAANQKETLDVQQKTTANKEYENELLRQQDQQLAQAEARSKNINKSSNGGSSGSGGSGGGIGGGGLTLVGGYQIAQSREASSKFESDLMSGGKFNILQQLMSGMQNPFYQSRVETSGMQDIARLAEQLKGIGSQTVQQTISDAKLRGQDVIAALKELAGQMVGATENLGGSIDRLANRPVVGSLSISSPNPVADSSSVINNLSSNSVRGFN